MCARQRGFDSLCLESVRPVSRPEASGGQSPRLMAGRPWGPGLSNFIEHQSSAFTPNHTQTPDTNQTKLLELGVGAAQWPLARPMGSLSTGRKGTVRTAAAAWMFGELPRVLGVLRSLSHLRVTEAMHFPPEGTWAQSSRVTCLRVPSWGGRSGAGVPEAGVHGHLPDRGWELLMGPRLSVAVLPALLPASLSH